jgi:ribosomal protein S12 methylthiotransferase
MNQVDSEHIMGGLVSLGFEITPEEEADIIVVNTCGFIEDACRESIDTIVSLAELKKSGSLKTLVVAGCLTERYKSELEHELTEADVFVGLGERDRIPQLCADLLGEYTSSEEGIARVITGPSHTAYIKITEGCDNRCSYCTIPIIRGPFRSTPFAALIREAEELASLGARELILVGQDITSYGKDLKNGETLAGLLSKLSNCESIAWLRLLYTHPSHLTNDIIEAVASLPKVVPYIDMPLQHIARPVLERMGRHISPESIMFLINRLRERIDGLVIRTTVMVGFPGETDEDFRELATFIEQTRFERLGVFMYSREEGTHADRMNGHIPCEAALERYETIMDIQKSIAHAFHTSLIGKEMDMIIDEVDTETKIVRGRTYMDAPDIDGTVIARGMVKSDAAFYRVIITGADDYDLYAEIKK